MTNANSGPNNPGHDNAQPFNYIPLEDAVEDSVDALEDAVEALPEHHEPDAEDLEDRLDTVEDAVDEAQDEGDIDLLGPVPALVNYLQQTSRNLAEQADDAADELEAFAVTVEGIEDALPRGIEQTRWFASVNGVAYLFDDRVVTVREVVETAYGADADPSTYTLEAFTSPADDDPDARHNRPDQEVDLGDYRHYRTRADKGGGQV